MQVNFYEFAGGQDTEHLQNTTQTHLQVGSLRQQTVYAFRVRAFTRSGPGPWSASTAIQTTAEREFTAYISNQILFNSQTQ